MRASQRAMGSAVPVRRVSLHAPAGYRPRLAHPSTGLPDVPAAADMVLPVKTPHLPPCKAIRAFCIQCQGGKKGAMLCERHRCPLWAFRMGRNPLRQGIGGRPVQNRKTNLS